MAERCLEETLDEDLALSARVGGRSEAVALTARLPDAIAKARAATPKSRASYRLSYVPPGRVTWNGVTVSHPTVYLA